MKLLSHEERELLALAYTLEFLCASPLKRRMKSGLTGNQ